MRTKRKTINLFDDTKVDNIKHVISISDEDDLNQCWDFLSTIDYESFDDVHALLTQFYNLALAYVLNKKTHFFEIILEQNKHYFYLTVWNKKTALLFKKYAKKTSLDFIYDDKLITIKLDKTVYRKQMLKLKKQNDKRQKNLIKSVSKPKKAKPIPAYTFIETDDLEELLKLSEDMQDFIISMKQNGINDSMFISIRSTFSMFCLILRYYNQISPMATTITHFSNLINQNHNKFILLDEDELALIDGFINNIDHWLQTLFIKGGADLHFMDNSIKADYDMISELIEPQKVEFSEEDLDDVFNF